QALARQELGMGKADRPDAGRALHARDIGQAADGTGGDRRSVRAGRADWLGPAVQPDGDDQPEPRAAEPDANPRPRRRSHLHPRARRAGPPRLQHEGEGEDAARRLRAPADADGHRHLQRPDAHPMDRKTGALALVAILALGALVGAAPAPRAVASQQPDPAGTGTFSILGYDPDTGELGAAVQSRVFSVGNGVLWAEAGVGVAATQAIVDASYGPQGIELLKKGMPPKDVIKSILDHDPDPRPQDWTKKGRQF